MPTAEPNPALGARARFPRSLDDLRSTSQCPACFTALTSRVCTNCQLDLSDASAARLATLSTDVAALLEQRTALIADMRVRSAAVAATEAAAATHAAATRADAERAAAALAAAAHLEAQQTAAHAAATRAARTVAAPPAGADPRPRERSIDGAPRRSSVQVLLIIVGVSLVSVAAIFFLVFAFINYGILWRSIIIAAITVSAFVVASLLKKRRLPSTAEGIGVFAVVLLLLDAFAVRANDLLGAAGSDGYVYWGTTLVLVSVVTAVWHRLSGLRVGSIAAFTLVTPGVGVLVAGLAAPLDGVMVVLLTSLGIMAAGLVHPLADRLLVPADAPRSAIAERVIVLAPAALAAVAALFAGFLLGPFATDGYRPGTASLALLATAGLSALHVVVVSRRATPTVSLRLFGYGFGVLSGIAASVAAALAGFDFASDELSLGCVAVASAVVATTFAVLALRTQARKARRLLLAVTGGAALITGITVLAPVGVAVVFSATVPILGLARAWNARPGSVVADPDLNVAACLAALALIVALFAMAAALTRRLRRAAPLLVWAGASVVLLSVPLLASLWAIVTAWFIVAAVALAILIRRRGTRRLGAGLALPLAAAAALGVAAGYASSWASTGTWLAASVATITLLVAARTAVTSLADDVARLGARAALLGVAVVVAVIATVAGAQLLVLARLATTDPTLDSLRFVTALGVLFVVLSLPRAFRGISALDRAVVFFSGALLAAVTVPVAAVVSADLSTPTLLAEPLTALVLAGALLAALVGWLAVPSGAGVPHARAVAALGLAPAAFWLIDSVFTVALPASTARVVAPALASLLVAATVLALSAARPGFRSRPAADLGVGLIVLGATLVPAMADSDLSWLCLLLGAVTVLILAISTAGPGAPDFRRKYLGWVALALVTGCLSTWLAMHAVAIAGIFLVGASLLRVIRRVSLVDRAVAFGIGIALVVVGWSAVATGEFEAPTPIGLADPVISLVLAAALLAALVGWLGLRSGSDLPWARAVAAVALAPSTFWFFDSVFAVAAPDSPARVLAPIGSSLFVAAAALVASTTRRSFRSRTMADLGVAAGVIVGIVVPLAGDSGFAWLCLVIASVTVLLLAVTGDGLATTDPRRRHLGWVALALATAGLWTWLASHSVAPVEPYVLPLAGALLAIAAVIERASGRRLTDATGPTAAPPPTGAASTGIAHHLVLAALLVSVLPIAVTSLDGTLTRAIVIAATSAVLLLAGSVPEAGARARRFLDALAGVGAVGLLLVSAGRAAGAGSGAALEPAVLDLWLAIVFVVLLIAAIGQARVSRTGIAARAAVLAPRALVVAGMALLLVFELQATGSGPFGWVRVVAIVALFAGIHVLGAALDRAPFDRVTGWVALGFAALAAAVGVRGDIVPTFEWVTVPVALALLASGALRLSRDPKTRSWPALGPGIALLLVLPLLATLGDRPVWRLVALGVLSVVVLVVGLIRRLQAPFLLGSIVALVHGIGTFSPQIVAVYQLTEWWWWAAPAGIVIIVLATRLERSIETTKSVTASIGALR